MDAPVDPGAGACVTFKVGSIVGVPLCYLLGNKLAHQPAGRRRYGGVVVEETQLREAKSLQTFQNTTATPHGGNLFSYCLKALVQESFFVQSFKS